MISCPFITGQSFSKDKCHTIARAVDENDGTVAFIEPVHFYFLWEKSRTCYFW